MSSRILFIAATFPVLFSACSSTNLTSFQDPAYKDAKFKKIVIISPEQDLSKRFAIEDAMTDNFTAMGVTAMSGYQVFTPTRTYSEEAEKRILDSLNVDAYLIVDALGMGYTEQYVSGTTTTTTKGRVSSNGEYKEKSVTTESDGTVSTPWAEFRAVLMDVKTGNQAWVSSAQSRGGAFVRVSRLIKNFSGKVVEDLLQKGLVQRSKWEK